jgi:hypothetical protein
MPFSDCRIIKFLRKVFQRKTIIKAESIKIEFEPKNYEKSHAEKLNSIISGQSVITGTFEITEIDELLFSPCPIVNCMNYDQCSKNLSKCDWMREEMVVMKGGKETETI